MEKKQLLILKPNLIKRILATLIDFLIFTFVGFSYLFYLGTEAIVPPISIVAGILYLLPLFIFWFIYFVCIETYFGATLGHYTFNLKVLKANRDTVRFSGVIKRHLLDPFDFYFYAIPAILAIIKIKKHQRLGDLWAGTIVVDTTDTEQYNIIISKIDTCTIYKFKPNLKKRILATLIDLIIFISFGTCYYLWVDFESKIARVSDTFLMFYSSPLFIFWFIYFVFIEAYFGATLGHRIFNLKVVKTNREAIRFTNALKRHLLDFIDFFYYGIPAVL